MIQIQNHQKSAKNAKISDFWGSKSGNTLKSVNFGPKNAKISPNWKWLNLEHQNYQIFTALPDLDLNIPKNRQFGIFDQFSVKKIWNIWGRCNNRTPNSRKAGYMWVERSPFCILTRKTNPDILNQMWSITIPISGGAIPVLYLNDEKEPRQQ